MDQPTTDAVERVDLLRRAGVSPPPSGQAYLDRACARRPGAAGRVEALLRPTREPASLLDCPRRATATASITPPKRPGTRIGPYKLLEQIGEGGMGVVWMAEQTEPVKRLVALKVIKPGMDSRQVSPASRRSGRRWR